MASSGVPTTSERISVTTWAGAAETGQLPALKPRAMLADGVDLGDVRAAAQERAGQRLIIGQRDALHGQRQQRRSAAGDQHEHPDTRGVRPLRRVAICAAPACPAASGTGWPASTMRIAPVSGGRGVSALSPSSVGVRSPCGHARSAPATGPSEHVRI